MAIFLDANKCVFPFDFLSWGSTLKQPTVRAINHQFSAFKSHDSLKTMSGQVQSFMTRNQRNQPCSKALYLNAFSMSQVSHENTKLVQKTSYYYISGTNI